MASTTIPQPIVRQLPPALSRVARDKPLIFALGVVGTISSIWWAARDYYRWKSLGPGGVPSNIFGWLRVSLLTPIAISQRQIADTTDLDSVVKQITSQEGEEAVFKRLNLLQRRGSRPEVRGVIPQRQMDHFGSSSILESLNAYIISLASDYPTILRIAPSKWEGRIDALFLRRSPMSPGSSHLLSSRILSKVAPHLEITHVHHDGSLHVALSPADAAEIIRKGWGVRHRLAGRFGLPSTYVLVYAPRDEDELLTVKKIIASTVEYSSGLTKVA